MRRKFDEEQLLWEVPRPFYVRETEPLAHPAAWPSQDPALHVDPKEQEWNRQIFFEGRKRIGKPVSGVQGQQKDEQQKKVG